VQIQTQDVLIAEVDYKVLKDLYESLNGPYWQYPSYAVPWNFDTGNLIT
jgi:hypothetical protein